MVFRKHHYYEDEVSTKTLCGYRADSQYITKNESEVTCKICCQRLANRRQVSEICRKLDADLKRRKLKV